MAMALVYTTEPSVRQERGEGSDPQRSWRQKMGTKTLSSQTYALSHVRRVYCTQE